MLGKRKREVAVAYQRSRPDRHQNNENTTAQTDKERDIFRQYFELSFEPLRELQSQTPPLLEDEEGVGDNSGTESEWEGLSNPSDEQTTVEVVEHCIIPNGGEDVEEQRQQYRSFMVRGLPKNEYYDWETEFERRVRDHPAQSS